MNGDVEEDTAEVMDVRMLEGVPLEVQEAWICEDLIFVLQVRPHRPLIMGFADAFKGIEGTLIRYAEGYDPLDEDQRLRGARWRVDQSLSASA